jgi:hypothetical protein
MSVFAHLPGWNALSPDLRREFEEADLPASFLPQCPRVCFAAGPDLTEVDIPGLGPRMLRFGRGASSRYYRDPTTGHVFIVGDDGAVGGFVNSGLTEMAATLRLVMSISQQILHGDRDEARDAADTFRRELPEIDKTADEWPLWDTFSSDIDAGDYSDHPNF